MAVDVRKGDGSERHTAGAGHKGLHGGVFAVVTLDRGRRLDLDHSPSVLAALLHRQHHIGEGQGPFCLVPCFEDRKGRAQQDLRARKRLFKAFHARIDQRAFALGVINLLSDIAHLMPGRKTSLSGCGVFTQRRLMNLQPQPLWTLAKGQ